MMHDFNTKPDENQIQDKKILSVRNNEELVFQFTFLSRQITVQNMITINSKVRSTWA